MLRPTGHRVGVLARVALVVAAIIGAHITTRPALVASGTTGGFTAAESLANAVTTGPAALVCSRGLTPNLSTAASLKNRVSDESRP